MQLITRKDSLIRIKTPYKNEEFVKEIKAIGGTWKTEEKYWEISFDHEEEARELVEKHFCRKEAVTLRERVDRAVQNKDALFSGNDDLERLLAFSFYYGKETGCRETSDQYRALLKSMRKKAASTRYYNMIEKTVLGPDNYIPMKDYAGRVTAEIGKLKTSL